MLNIYKASAGSGKTYTLTREYITLLLGRRDPDTGRWTLNKEPRQAHRHIRHHIHQQGHRRDDRAHNIGTRLAGTP